MSTEPHLDDPSQKATFREWVACLGAILGAFVAILDVSITNSSLQNIQGTLGASSSEGSWISTAYLVTEIIVIPLTAFLAHVFSTRSYLLGNIILFLLFSALCGTAKSLGAMIAFRAMQGFVGGALIPTAMTIVMGKLHGSQRSIGLALFGLATTFAPAIGPSLGGWLTTQYGWPFIFYINFLPGIVLIITVVKGLDVEPKQLKALRTADWPGIAYLAVFLATLTTVLEEGNQDDWFGSNFITGLAATCLISFGLLVWRELHTKNPIVDFHLLLKRNFLTTCVLGLTLGSMLYGASFLVPFYLGGVQRYNALEIGRVMMWSGLPQLLVLPFIPLLVAKVDNKLLVCAGFGMMALSARQNAAMSHDFAGLQFIPGQIFRALGMPLIVVPLTGIAYDKLAAKDNAAASGLFNMMRNLGGSVGIGLLKTAVSRRYSFHFGRLAELATTVNQPTQDRLKKLTHALMSQGLDPHLAQGKALAAFGLTMNRESYVMAFGDSFYLLFVAMFLSMLLCLTLNRVKGAVVAGH
jgi:DHA2 family multidrug resistance protein